MSIISPCSAVASPGSCDAGVEDALDPLVNENKPRDAGAASSATVATSACGSGDGCAPKDPGESAASDRAWAASGSDAGDWGSRVAHAERAHAEIMTKLCRMARSTAERARPYTRGRR